MAAQLTGTKLLPPRGLFRWMALATSSLPVPDSPWMRTVLRSSSASFSIRPNSCRMHSLRPIRLPKESLVAMVQPGSWSASLLVVRRMLRLRRRRMFRIRVRPRPG